MTHPFTPTAGTDTDVDLPQCKKQFLRFHPGIQRSEHPLSLDFEDELQILPLTPVVQEPIIADFLKPGREHVHQKTAQEFGVCQRDCFRFAGFVIPGSKGRLRFRDGEDAGITDSNPMDITAKIINGIAKSVEGFFCMWNPGLAVEGILKRLPFIRIAQPGAGNRSFPAV